MVKWLVGGCAGLLVFVFAIVLGVAVAGSTAAACGGGPVNAATIPADAKVGAWDAEQLRNAAAIMNAAATMSLPVRAEKIGVMTAMGESSLRNITYGDNAINPNGTIADSIGLFQQQSSWGTATDRMDPATAARLFFTRLVKVPGWENLDPSQAAHRVQVNSDPNHYTRWWNDAVTVTTQLNQQYGSPGAGCTPAAGAGAAPGGWGGYTNGNIPASALASIPWAPTRLLRADAVTALSAMNVAFRAQFGYDLPINDAYRSYQGQVDAKATRGKLAAKVGTSVHGWGLAIDVGEQNHTAIGYGSATYAWLKTNGPRYGWQHPAWAEPDGSGPHEAWHFEYHAPTP